MTANRNRAREGECLTQLTYNIQPQSRTKSWILAAIVVENVPNLKQNLQRNVTNPPLSSSAVQRCRPHRWRSVSDMIYRELGSFYFRRAYRMTNASFRRFAALLRPLIIAACGTKRAPRYCPNGPISPDVWLACAIWWLAGGSTYDVITSTFGISCAETINSYWYVVDAINQHPRFEIAYPDDHEKQQSIAVGFAEVSSAGFWCCSGAMIHKLLEAYCSNIWCSPGKFLCGRKEKFDLNCQTVCNVRRQFLDISILYPGSTSDCLAFEGKSLFHQLEQGILAPELCLFGDNAYLNAAYMMATPFAAVSGGSRDA